MKASNPLNNIAANLGVTPKVLTQLATGEDKEFRELVRGILSILPENEVSQVASDPEINPEFLDYLCHLFESNRKIMLTILQNPVATYQTKRYVLERLPQEMLSSLVKNPRTPPEILRILGEHVPLPGNTAQPTVSTAQGDDFKIKMKVSKLLNDLEANLGVTIEAFLQIRARHDEESQEFVQEVYNALPENHVLIVARDQNTTPKILDYLSRLFDTNQKVLLTILHNPSAEMATKHFILNHLPENIAFALAENPKTPPHVLRFLGEHFTSSVDLLATLLANPTTPLDAKEQIQALAMPETEQISIEEILAGDLLPDLQENEEDATENNVDAKIALCVDRLYDINADIVTEFIKKARAEIIKRLTLMAKANRIILRTLVRHPELSIEELSNINMDTFVSLLKQSPDQLDDDTVLKIIRQAQQSSESSAKQAS